MCNNKIDLSVFGMRSQYWKIYLIALIHLVLVVYGLKLTINEMIVDEYPATKNEIVKVVILYISHFALIACLLLATNLALPYLFLPWLFITFTVLTTVSFWSISSLKVQETSHFFDFLENTCELALYWMAWTSVYTTFTMDFRKLRKTTRT